MRILAESVFREFMPRAVCFAEQDGAEPAAGGAAAEPEVAVEDLEPEPEEEDGEDAELEIGAEKLKVPKKVKEAWDGVQKTTQTERERVATLEKAAGDREKAAQATMKHARDFLEEVTEIRSIDKQLAPYLAYTQAQWMAWAEQDAKTANETLAAVNAMKLKRDQLAEGIKTKLTAAQESEKTNRELRIAKAAQELANKIPEWSPAKSEQLEKIAVNHGFSAEEVAMYKHDPRVMTLLHEVSQFRAAKERAKARAAKDNADQPPPEPLAKPKARPAAGNSSMPSDRDTPEQFQRKFNAMMHPRKAAH